MSKNNAKLNQKYFSLKSTPQLAYDSSQLEDWLLHVPIGREILRKERVFFLQNVGNMFGSYSLQIGLTSINLLHGNKIQNHYTLNSDLKADLRFLPFASNSIDLIICPHILEFTNNYHHVLQELQRILAPNGTLILTCFNRYSWFGLFKNRIPLLKKTHLISLEQLKSQLQTLNFNLEGGKFFSYSPPFTKAEKLSKYQWLNKVGDRWFPTLANSFAIIAKKEIITPNLIRNKESKSFATLKPNLGSAPLCQKS